MTSQFARIKPENNYIEDAKLGFEVSKILSTEHKNSDDFAETFNSKSFNNSQKKIKTLKSIFSDCKSDEDRLKALKNHFSDKKSNSDFFDKIEKSLQLYDNLNSEKENFEKSLKKQPEKKLEAYINHSLNIFKEINQINTSNSDKNKYIEYIENKINKTKKYLEFDFSCSSKIDSLKNEDLKENDNFENCVSNYKIFEKFLIIFDKFDSLILEKQTFTTILGELMIIFKVFISFWENNKKININEELITNELIRKFIEKLEKIKNYDEHIDYILKIFSIKNENQIEIIKNKLKKIHESIENQSLKQGKKLLEIADEINFDGYNKSDFEKTFIFYNTITEFNNNCKTKNKTLENNLENDQQIKSLIIDIAKELKIEINYDNYLISNIEKQKNLANILNKFNKDNTENIITNEIENLFRNDPTVSQILTEFNNKIQSKSEYVTIKKDYENFLKIYFKNITELQYKYSDDFENDKFIKEIIYYFFHIHDFLAFRFSEISHWDYRKNVELFIAKKQNKKNYELQAYTPDKTYVSDRTKVNKIYHNLLDFFKYAKIENLNDVLVFGYYYPEYILK